MRKLTLIAVMLMVVMASVGCQSTGLSEREIQQVRYIASEEIYAKDYLEIRGLLIKNADGQTVLALSSEVDGNGHISIYNGDGKLIATLGVSSIEDQGTLTLRNLDGERTVRLGDCLWGERSNSGLELYNMDGIRTIEIGSSEKGDGCIYIYDSHMATTFAAP